MKNNGIIINLDFIEYMREKNHLNFLYFTSNATYCSVRNKMKESRVPGGQKYICNWLLSGYVGFYCAQIVGC
jgi:hypothetical protein